MKVIIDDVEYVAAPPVCSNASPLDVRMYVKDIGEEISLRGYLLALLGTLWKEGEAFSAERPFGNSGWEYDVYKFLVKAKAIDGNFDGEGDLDGFDKKAAHEIMPGLIAAAMGCVNGQGEQP